MAVVERGMYDGATEPLYFGDRQVWSVTGFVMGVRRRIDDIPTLWVQGEISELKAPQHLQTAFFTLKDPENGFMLSCTIPRSRLEALRLDLRDGDLVQAFGRADIYPARGTFQLRVQSLELAGRGLLLQQLEALREKLAAEGLFDESRKKPLPYLPRRVGIITGAGAAAQGDFLRNITERFPPVKLVMVETLVQGDRAAPQLVAALAKLQQVEDVDVIVITRGGGAFEDFLPFCDERLCRAIAACPIPVVSAIGHEKDSPISDDVADLRASTPTAAARTVVPDYADVTGRLQRARLALRRRGADRVQRRTEQVHALRGRLTERSPARFVEQRREWIGSLRQRATTSTAAALEGARLRAGRDGRSLDAAIRSLVAARTSRQQTLLAALRALSPKATLERGYAIVRGPVASDADGAGAAAIVRDAAALAAGDRIEITLARGSAAASIDQTNFDPLGAADDR